MKLIIEASDKEIAGLVFALQGQRIEQLLPLKDSQYDDGLFCLCQHFVVWYEQMKRNVPVNFAALCASCKNRSVCSKRNYPWDDFISPILRSQGLRIQMGIQGHEAITHTDPVHQDRDSH